jgi:hypothetical protein
MEAEGLVSLPGPALGFCGVTHEIVFQLHARLWPPAQDCLWQAEFHLIRPPSSCPSYVPLIPCLDTCLRVLRPCQTA